MRTGRREPLADNVLRISHMAGLETLLRKTSRVTEINSVTSGQPLQQTATNEVTNVIAATTANIASLSGLQTIDNVIMPDRGLVMVRQQSVESQNGIYEISSSTWRKISTNGDKLLVYVEAGTENGNSLWFTPNGTEFHRPWVDISDGSITDSKIGSRTASDSIAPAAGIVGSLTGLLTPLLSVIFTMIKSITGKSTGNTLPDITLAQTKSHVDASAPHTGHELVSKRGAANGYCDLDSSAKIPSARIANGSITDSKLDATGVTPGVYNILKGTINAQGRLTNAEDVSTSIFAEPSIGHIIGSTPVPTISAGAAAGTGPTVIISGNDIGGKISVVTGTSTVGSDVLCTITFGTVYSASAPTGIVISPANADTASIAGRVYVDGATISISNFSLSVGSTSLNATTTYEWFYVVIG